MNYDYEINVVDLGKHLIKKWFIIIICCLIGLLLSLGYVVKSTKTYYKASSTVLVVEENDSQQVTDIIKSEKIIGLAIYEAQSNKSVQYVVDNLKFEKKLYNNELVVEYQDYNKQDANNILRSIIIESTKIINKTEGYNVRVAISAHSIGSIDIGPSKLKSCLFGTLCGGALSVVILSIIYVLENKIRDISFVENVLGYRVISTLDKKQNNSSLYAKLVYGYPDCRLISLDGFDNTADDVVDPLISCLLEAGKKVLIVKQEDNDKVLKPEKLGNNLYTMRYNYSDDSRVFVLNRLRDYLNELKQDYDYIIINTNVLKNELYSLVFDSICDGTVLVLTKDQTNANSIVNYKKQLEIVDANIIGVVVRMI